jgi:short subunit fatty acids transporter
MNNKFSNEDIDEIASRLKWKPNDLSYGILYAIIICIILILLIIIYLVLVNRDLKCKFTKIHNYLENLNIKASTFENKTNTLQENILNNSNEIRYLVSQSGRKTNNTNLLQRSGMQMPIFENERNNPLLYASLNGN